MPRKMYRVHYSTDGSPLVSDVMYSAIETCIFIRKTMKKAKKKNKLYGMFIERGWSLGNWEKYEDQKLYNDLEDEMKPINKFMKNNKINSSELAGLLKDVVEYDDLGCVGGVTRLIIHNNGNK